MSSLEHMNDPQEIKIGLDIVIDFFNSIFPELVNKVNWEAKDSDYFLCCSFSLDGDVLSQWRSYAEDGTGVAIGFDEQLLSICNSEDDFKGLKIPNRHSIDSVFYDNEEFANYVRDYLKDFRNSHGIPSDDRKEPYAKLAKQANTLLRIACRYKESFYKEEKEVRYIVPTNTTLLNRPISKEDRRFDFRVTRAGLTPYSHLDIKKDTQHAIKEVVLGPKNPSKIGDVALFLNMNGFSSVDVSKSEGQYR